MFVIKSGDNGYTADVNELGELKTFAVTESVLIRKALNAESYLITTPIITLTTDTVSHIFYMRNTGLLPWIIQDSEFRFGSTDGVGDITQTGTLNPSGGTLLTAGTDFPANNLDLANQIPLSAELKFGAEGSTVTGGTGGDILIPDPLDSKGPSPIIIRPGTALAVGFTPPTGNTSMNVQVSYLLLNGE